jgi:hypothetical protein
MGDVSIVQLTFQVHALTYGSCCEYTHGAQSEKSKSGISVETHDIDQLSQWRRQWQLLKKR